MSLAVLYEDNHLLVIDKPAGIATMGAESGPTIHSLACDYLKRKYNKPGNVYVGIVSRLDSMTSGVLVLARTSKAAARLQKQFADKDRVTGPAKVYLALVEGVWDREAGHLEDFVVKDDSARRMRVVPEDHSNAKAAHCEFLTIARSDHTTLLAVRLLTGRKHQIRVQLAHRNHAILGDRKYAADAGFPIGIALHSWRLRLQHPTVGDDRWYTSPPPTPWNRSLRKLRVDSVEDHWPLVAEQLRFSS